MLVDDLFEAEMPRVIVTYPGRFQPFHQGHHAVFKILQKTFGANNVFILTSDKTDGKKSPFNFADKVVLMTTAGVPGDRIIETSNMYSLPEEMDARNTIFITALGAPDADRLKPDTLTAKDSTDKLGNFKPAGSPSYYKMWTGKNPVTADKHGYVVIIPEIKKTIKINGKSYDVSHGTECRELWNMVRNNPQAQQQFLTQLYGQATEELAQIFNKIPSHQKTEDLSPMGTSTISPISGNVKEEAAGVGVIANKKQRKDPRYSTSLTKDVKPGAIQHSLRAFRLAETKKHLNEFNPLIAAAAAGAGLATGAATALRYMKPDEKTQQQRIRDERKQTIDKSIKDKTEEQPTDSTLLKEKWSKKYKKSINCDSPKGFSQRAHCAGRKARQAGKTTKSSSINESVQNKFIDMLGDMLKIAMDQLKLDHLPPIKLHKHLEAHDGQATFGRYVNNENTIHLGLIGRHPVDIFRTLAHELVHYKQSLDNKLNANSGDTGSPEENEAHAEAGIIMRRFNKKFPEAIGSEPLLD